MTLSITKIVASGGWRKDTSKKLIIKGKLPFSLKLEMANPTAGLWIFFGEKINMFVDKGSLEISLPWT
jgi:hypothetical protein